ncbi:MAG: type VI secretion system baseplate subunit TssK [Deltaproteobacteria bacterium]|nr:type VI secretion system baseplate subunit TssK [Deltaproteobacteria bacterium]MBK8240565.1 type VI secretion system baseplate subunit TssK [Deltaproteobacteria bacterium]MBK8718155.1 type VI secretion system baseplate subunit TssK [Deltaproteobacteria bacterium]MBP7292197.1 type VI secretion system baseplate subunit TssK [Nannocystaceae bacterium]
MAKRNLDRVVWTEGMLMCPQHLQQQDQFMEATLSSRLAAAAPVAWGVVAMTIDDGALKAGSFKLTEFVGVLSAGLPVEFSPSEGGAPAARPIADAFPTTAPMLEVYLAVPASREGIPNYQDAIDDTANARFRIANRPVQDLTIAKTEQIVAFGQPNLSIVFGTEARDDFETVKIAEIVRDGTGSFALSRNYIPPALKVAASPVLASWMQDLLSVMLTKQRALSETRRQIDAAAVEFTGQDITRFLLLNALNTYIPHVRHITETRVASPLSCYLTLIELGGALTTFSSEVDPSSFPRFNHADLRSSFEELFGLLNKMLGATVRELCITVPLEARQDGMWIGQLKDDRLPRCPRFVLAVEAEGSQQDVANRLPKLSKIASWKQINQIVRSATPGVPLVVTHRPPSEVPVRPKQVYFMLDVSSDFWRQIATERTVAIYLPPPFDPSKAKIVLMGVPERAAQA